MQSMCRSFAVRALAGGVVLGLMSVAVPSVHADTQSVLATGTETDFRNIVRSATEAVFPAVVYIRVVTESHESGKQEYYEASGSGVIISDRGEVLTNWHVVDKATEVRCLLADGQAFDAEIVGTDQDTDLGLLRLKGTEEQLATLPYAPFGDSKDLIEGDFVMAMGAPWGLNRSVSIGIVGCTDRFLPEASQYSKWIQTDAAISPGNSGGPLVNTLGEVVGINSRGMFFGGDMGFSIPSDTVKVLLPMLRQGEVDWSWFGFQLQPLRDFDRDTYFEGDRGVIVSETDPASPARRAGILQQDRIIAVNGTPLTALTNEDLPHVRRTIGLLIKGLPARFEIERKGEVIAVDITPREKGAVEGEELDLPRWDMTIKEINQFDNPDLYFHQEEGVFVYGVRYPGNAAMSGLSHQDILLSVNNQPVATLDDVRAIHEKTLETIDDKPKIVMAVLRAGLMRHVVVDISRDHDRE
ncbi:MAG: trypsin-like peptidase domain-containing protein [Planctomycetota bacterium]